jgi:hypothetical protein
MLPVVGMILKPLIDQLCIWLNPEIEATVYSYPPFQTLDWLSGLNLTIPNGIAGPGNNIHLEFDVPVNTFT